MIRRIASTLAFSLALAACGGGSAPVTGIAASGEDLFSRTVLAENAGCVTCHSLKEGVVLVGPSLASIGADASDRQPGVSAADYLRTSIVAPDDFVLDGFDPGRMPQDWIEQLSDSDIDALVEYLLTLGVE